MPIGRYVGLVISPPGQLPPSYLMPVGSIVLFRQFEIRYQPAVIEKVERSLLIRSLRYFK